MTDHEIDASRRLKARKALRSVHMRMDLERRGQRVCIFHVVAD